MKNTSIGCKNESKEPEVAELIKFLKCVIYILYYLSQIIDLFISILLAT